MYLRIRHWEKSVVKLVCESQSGGSFKSNSQVTISKEGIIQAASALRFLEGPVHRMASESIHLH